MKISRTIWILLRALNNNCSYFEALEVKAEKMANTDLATLGDIEKMGNVIKTRLENGWCKISEMYAVKHDKDESKLWNEYTMTYDVKFTWQTKDSAVSNIFKRRKYVV